VVEPGGRHTGRTGHPLGTGVLRAGPVTATFEAGVLRWITLGDEEIVRAIYSAVRDSSWDTIVPTFSDYEVEQGDDSFVVRFCAEHVRGEVDFAWFGLIEGTSDGTIRFSMDGVARHVFRRARIGFCVLHPREFAGRPLEIETPWGSFSGTFPTRIASVSMFNNIQTMRHSMPSGARVSIRFEGDLFETEDQRNFGDASFKTFCTPLCLASPVLVEEGDKVRQVVTISVVPGPVRSARRVREGSAVVQVGEVPVAPLPSIGLCAARFPVSVPDEAVARLRSLRLAHLRVVADADGPELEDQCAEGHRLARALGCPVELELVSDPSGIGVDEAIARFSTPDVGLAHLLVYDRATSISTKGGISRARASAQGHGLRVPIGGGSRGYFAMLNMNAIPIEMLDVVTYGTSAQVHAFDDATVMENVATLADTVDTGRSIAAGRPLAVGPVGMTYPFNPWAVTTMPPRPDGMPYGYDRRQSTQFGAAWTLGALSALARPGVGSVTLGELTGWRGVIAASQTGMPRLPCPDGTPFPVFDLLADIAGFGPCPDVLPVTTPPGIAVLALRQSGRIRVLVANLKPTAQRVSVRFRHAEGTVVRGLTAARLESEPTTVADDVGVSSHSGRLVSLEMGPYAIARVDRQGAGPRSQGRTARLAR